MPTDVGFVRANELEYQNFVLDEVLHRMNGPALRQTRDQGGFGTHEFEFDAEGVDYSQVDLQRPIVAYHPLYLYEAGSLQTVTGLQARLANLGYYDGPIDGDAGPVTAAAIAQFRREYGLPLGDQVDDDLRKALEGLHDNDQLPDGSEPDQTFREDDSADDAGPDSSETGDTGDEGESTGDATADVQEDEDEYDMDALVDEEWDGDWEEESEEDEDGDDDADPSDGSTQE